MDHGFIIRSAKVIVRPRGLVLSVRREWRRHNFNLVNNVAGDDCHYLARRILNPNTRTSRNQGKRPLSRVSTPLFLWRQWARQMPLRQIIRQLVKNWKEASGEVIFSELKALRVVTEMELPRAMGSGTWVGRSGIMVARKELLRIRVFLHSIRCFR
jgi:hypothetical protein